MRKRLIGLLSAGAIIVAACGSSTATPSPTGSPSASGPAASGQPTPIASAAAEQTLRMVMDGDVSGGLTNAADSVPTSEAAAFMYDAIYGYDASLTPVNNLAAEAAEVTEGGKVWTITLKEGVKFHDGSDLTAEDVVQTWEIAQSKNCRYNPSICLTGILEKVEAVDDTTVKFTLVAPNATMATVFLPAILIENKDAIDAAYARYQEDVKAVTQAEVQALIDKVVAEETTPTGPAGEDGKPTADYGKFQAELEGLIQKAGQELPDKTIFTSPEGALDAALYVGDLRNRAQAIIETYSAGRIDALAAAYSYLDIQRNPAGMGSGPFKFVSFKTGESIELEANAEYHQGAPELDRIFLPIIKDDLAGGTALAQDQVDWKYSLDGPTYNQIKDDPNLQFIEYPDFGFFALYFNLHPDTGSPWLDKSVRQATSYCFDKEATAKAATEDQGVAVYSEIPPASWAFPSTGLETYPFDATEGKDLLEAAGWKVGADGIREKDGVKLSTVAAVRAERASRSKWMQLMGDQVRTNCGIDITYKEVDFAAINNMLNNYPHINAADQASGKPYYAYFGGFGASFDPDPYSLYHSNECSSTEKPQTFNYICYSNPDIDKLIDAGLATTDQAERTKIYQEYAILQAQDLPVIYAWSDIAREGLRKSVGSTGGPLVMDSPTWFWETHKLTNVK